MALLCALQFITALYLVFIINLGKPIKSVAASFGFFWLFTAVSNMTIVRTGLFFSPACTTFVILFLVFKREASVTWNIYNWNLERELIWLIINPPLWGVWIGLVGHSVYSKPCHLNCLGNISTLIHNGRSWEFPIPCYSIIPLIIYRSSFNLSCSFPPLTFLSIQPIGLCIIQKSVLFCNQ